MIHFSKKVILDMNTFEVESKRSKTWMRESQLTERVVQNYLQVYSLIYKKSIGDENKMTITLKLF